jgi:hypothetical protein
LPRPVEYQIIIDDSGSMGNTLQFSSNPDGTVSKYKRTRWDELKVTFSWLKEGLKVAGLNFAGVPVVNINQRNLIVPLSAIDSSGPTFWGGSTPSTDTLIDRVAYMRAHAFMNMTTLDILDGDADPIHNFPSVFREAFPDVELGRSPTTGAGQFARVVWEMQKEFPHHFFTFIGIGDNTDFLDDIDCFVSEWSHCDKTSTHLSH